ncbi:MAG: TonB-dependent receptor [Alphaproteobacteria bacterium]|nr:TonB-dependent receptor [Alphaproteobacteria bacterium]
MRRLATLLGIAGAALSLCAETASAQNVKYGELETIFGEPVTTSATGKPQRVSEAPVTMIIITADQIAHAAATDIPGILREYTDLDVLEYARGDVEVSARGYDKVMSSSILVLINGRQVYLDNRGFTDWHSLPVQRSEIYQIEVVKGPNSALFGFNASGGVINIVTANPMYDTVNTMAVRDGSGHYKEASAIVTAPLGQSGGLRLSAGGLSANNYSTSTLWEGPNSLTSVTYWNKPIEKRSVNLDGALPLNDNVTGRIEASHAQNARVLFWDDDNAYYVHTVVDSVKGAVTVDTRSGQIDASMYANIADMNDGIGDDQRTKLYVASLQGLFKIGPTHAFRVATEYRYNTMNTFPVEGANIFYSNYSTSGMWDWTMTPQWSLTNAMRFDHLQLGRSGTAPLDSQQTNAAFRQSYDAVSANSGIVYRLTDVDKIHVSFGRGVELPSLSTFALQQQSPVPGLLSDGALAGNPGLKPTVVTSVEAGYNRDLPAISSKVSSQIFYQTTKDLVSLGD